MTFHLPLSDLLALLPDAQAVGNAPASLSGIASLQEAGPTDLSFLGNKKYRATVPTCQAGVILVPLDYDGTPRPGQAYLRVPNPSLALAAVCGWWEARLAASVVPGIHPTASLDPSAVISPDASIGPYCVVGAGCSIGSRTRLHPSVVLDAECRVGSDCELFPHVVLYRGSRLGDRVRIHAGAVIGSDGFGYETVQGRHLKVPQMGAVVIEDDVEIGANTTIDRARFAETRIGAGSKIDNLVQVAHNVQIGEACLIAAQAGISGSTSLGKHVVLGGQCGLAGHLHLGDQSMIGGQAGVSKSYPPKSFLVNSPALDFKEAYRLEAYKRRLPELVRRLAALEERIGLQPADAPQRGEANDAAPADATP